MRRLRRTKIVATLGPASNTPEMIEKLIDAGANVFRLNFSHGERADHDGRVDLGADDLVDAKLQVAVVQQ